MVLGITQYTKNIYLPASVSPATIRGCAKFRSKNRIPVLSYLYKKKTAILRCAQPMAGVQGKRSEDDEAMIEAVYRANPSGKPVMIVDTRPKLNARANALKGKGFEVPRHSAYMPVSAMSNTDG